MTNHLQGKNWQSLGRQLYLGFCSALVLMGLLTFLVVYDVVANQSKHHIEQNARQIVEGIEFAAEGLIELKDPYLLERLVQNYATWPSVDELSIVSPEGMLIAHSDSYHWHTPQASLHLRQVPYQGFEPTLAPLLAQSIDTGSPLSETIFLHDQQVLVYILPLNISLFDSPRIAASSLASQRGAVIAVMNRQELLKNTRMVSVALLTTLLISMGLTLVVLGVIIQRLVLSPLGSLRHAIVKQRPEDPFLLPSLPPNEIGFLGETLSQTFERLKHYQDQALQSAERKYIEIAQRYELASQATRVWIWEWEPGSDRLDVDASFLTWLGFEPETPANGFVPCRDFFLVDGDRPRFWQLLHQWGQKENVPEFTSEYRLQNVTGQVFWGLVRGQFYPQEFDQKQRIIGTITDITERKLYEEQLQFANQTLERATRLKDEFLANMSHELRTPLNAILGMTEGLQDEIYGPLTPKQQNCLTTVDLSGRHLLTLINDILDLSKIEADKFELTLAPTAIADLCTGSLTFVKHLAFQKHITLTCHVDDDLPPILLDERRIRQVLINLLNNAVKFTPEGGTVTLTAVRQTAPEGDRLRITVEDTGIGIAPENLSQLFQPFVQIDSALNRRYDGTGLGLALVKKIVELHGGTVGVTSQLQVGSCFSVNVPWAAKAASSLPSAPQTEDG
ncbi:MAG: ATP-binding protein [Synechocystis sp.]|nr:ATP-binding protein [Synechocystis sp.]